MGLVPGRWSPWCAPKFSFHFPTGWKQKMDGHNPFPVFSIWCWNLRICAIDCLPWECKCSKKVQETRVSTFVDHVDRLSFEHPSFDVLPAAAFFFCFWGGIICSSTSSISPNIERWKKTLNSTKAGVLMFTGKRYAGVRCASTFFMISSWFTRIDLFAFLMIHLHGYPFVYTLHIYICYPWMYIYLFIHLCIYIYVYIGGLFLDNCNWIGTNPLQQSLPD